MVTLPSASRDYLQEKNIPELLESLSFHNVVLSDPKQLVSLVIGRRPLDRISSESAVRGCSHGATTESALANEHFQFIKQDFRLSVLLRVRLS